MFPVTWPRSVCAPPPLSLWKTMLTQRDVKQGGKRHQEAMCDLSALQQHFTFLGSRLNSFITS